MIPAERGCLTLMWPLAQHPVNKNEIIAWDLRADPSELRSLDADTLRQRLFTRSSELPEGVTRLPMKTIHINKSPMVVRNLKTLTPEMAQRWGLDVDACLQHALIARDLPDMSALWQQVYATAPATAAATPVLPEENLYGGFVGAQDRRRLNQLRELLPQELAVDNTGFDDPRLSELVFRWRARNWPETLRPEEQTRWREHCAQVLLHGQGGGPHGTAVVRRNRHPLGNRGRGGRRDLGCPVRLAGDGDAAGVGTRPHRLGHNRRFL